MDGLVVVATVYRNTKFIGYRFVNINTMDVKDVSYDSFKNVMKQNIFRFLNCSIRSDDSIHGIGMSISELAKIDLYYSSNDKNYCLDKKPMVLLERTRLNTYVALDFAGKFEQINYKTLDYYKDRFVNSTPIINNFKPSTDKEITVKDRVGKLFDGDTFSSSSISSKSNNEPKVQEEKANIDISNIRDDLSGTVQDKSASKYAGFELIEDSVINTDSGNVYLTTSGMHIIDFNANDDLYDYKNLSKMTAGSKLALAILALRDLNYFYFSILQSLERILVEPDNKFVPTACVSKDTLYINVGFIDSIDNSEVLFVLMHEVMHIFFRHIFFGLKKDPKIHNIATDLIINASIGEEYGAAPNKGKQDLSSYGSYAKACGIKFPDGGLWNDNIDLSVDTSETIYIEIMDSLQDSNTGSSSNCSSGNSSSNGSSSGGSSSDGNDSSIGSSSDGNTSGDKPNKGSGKDGKDSGDDSNNSDSCDKQGNDKSGKGNSSKSNVVFRGKVYKCPNDMALSSDDAKSIGEEGADAFGESCTNIVNKAATSTKAAGYGLSPKIEAQLNIVNIRLVTWQKLLKDYLSKLGDVYYTYSAVNKRYIGLGVIMPGPRVSQDNLKQLSNIVLAIDTSGSMFDEETLSRTISLCASIVKKYKADGEILLWDTEVASSAKFKNKDELVRASVKGGGGTDINCVFEYLDKKYPRKNDKPSLVLVMTDGCFCRNLDDKYVKTYKNVIWAIEESFYPEFKNPNGKKAVIKE